jgi:hypothetical protein
LGDVPLKPAMIDENLRGVIDAFNAKYAESDIYKLGSQEFNYIQVLLRNRDNSYVTQDTTGAIKAFSRGIQLLEKVPTVSNVVQNPVYKALLESMNYFMSEWALRNLGRAIPNDRLFLNDLKNNVASYTDLYTVPQPNMRNYDVLVTALTDQYKQGLRLLRTYPMKT